MRNFEKLLKLLIDNEVDFVLIGGYAATVYGCSLLTQDIDICTSFGEPNLKNLIRALRDHHPIHRENKKPLADDYKALSRFKNLYLLTDFGPLDLLSEVSGVGPFEEVKSHSIEIELFDKKCCVLDIDYLIKAKQQMTRAKDKETVLQLKAIRERLKE